MLASGRHVSAGGELVIRLAPAAANAAENTAKAASPPSSTGRGPTRLASAPNTGLSSTLGAVIQRQQQAQREQRFVLPADVPPGSPRWSERRTRW